MNIIDKLERKFGRYGIPNLMRYVIIVNIIGVLVSSVNPTIYYSLFSLDVYKILHGQIWRFVTFLFYPSASLGDMLSLLMFALWAFVYYSIGISLERIWGTFRFNLFYLGGVVFVIVASFLAVPIMSVTYPGSTLEAISYYVAQGVTFDYLNESLFLAFALMFPDAQFLIYFVIPVKAKWLSIVYFLLSIYQLVLSILSGEYFVTALIVGSLLNLAVFFLCAKGKPGARVAYQQRKRRVQYKKKMQQTVGDTIHRCAICGKTEKDASGLDFRYCSKCEGSYEYCSEHLFTHEHVRR